MSAKAMIQIEQLVDRLTFVEQIEMVERLARRLRQTVQTRRPPQDLYGIWQGCFPANLDLDAVLSDIRHEWEQEWPQEAQP